MLAGAQDRATGLHRFINEPAEEDAELLRRYAPVLRPMLLRASMDPSLSGVGRAAADNLAERIRAEMLVYPDDMTGDAPERSLSSAHRMIHATLARYPGFGSSQEASDEGYWTELKQDLGEMCAAFRPCASEREGRLSRATEWTS